MKIKILENNLNKLKIKKALQNQIKKKENLKTINKEKQINNPIKINKNQKLNLYNLNNGESKNNDKSKNKKVVKQKKGAYKNNQNNDIKLLLFISKTEKKKPNKKILKKSSIIKLKGDKNKYLSFKNNVRYKMKRRKNKSQTEIYGLVNYNLDDQVDEKEINRVPFSQAIRIDKRNYCQIFMSFLAKEIDIINIFYYKNPYEHISISLSLYVFESCVDFTFNCFLCSDDVVSQKYHNKGSLKFLTSFSISLLSNIISSLIVFFIEKIVDYGDKLEYIVKEIYKKSSYLYTYIDI